jgi:hypothetical protein
LAELFVFPDKVIQIDDEDFEKLSGYTWRTIDNVSGRIGRRLENRRIIGLAATLLGKRPAVWARISFRDKNLRNFRKANIFWDESCTSCGRPMDRGSGGCLHCRTEFAINNRFKSARMALRSRQPYYYYGTVD